MRSIIVKKAADIYRRYGVHDLCFVAEKLGTRVYEILDADKLEEVYFPDLKAIVLKPNLPFYLKSYDVAHGLGHHLFHRKGLHRSYLHLHIKGVFGSLELGRIEIMRKEREADLFAAYLLVPESRLKPMLGQTWIDEADDPVLKLALEYDGLGNSDSFLT